MICDIAIIMSNLVTIFMTVIKIFSILYCTIMCNESYLPSLCLIKCFHSLSLHYQHSQNNSNTKIFICQGLTYLSYSQDKETRSFHSGCLLSPIDIQDYTSPSTSFFSTLNHTHYYYYLLSILPNDRVHKRLRACTR